MTQFLPANLLALFAPRDPIPYLPPVDQLPYEKQTAGYTGLAAFVKEFEDPSETPPPVKIETREERQERRRKMKAEQVAYKLEQDIALWQPTANPNATSDPYKTLFVARINYDTSETKISREFQVYGPIRKVVKVNNTFTMKPRGYAFIEYEHERDMHSAYKHADGKKLSNRRVLVDVERGRIVKGWLPRRLGGGLGGTRKGGPDVNIKHSGREEAAPDSRYIGGGGAGGGGSIKDRTMDRDRSERPERPERRRSRSRERRRRSRSRSRDRHRGERRKRDRSRDRSDRGRDHDTGSTAEKTEGAADGVGEGGPEAEPPRKERRRSRSRDRERKHRRSRSRDRKRRDHGDRDRDRDRDRESRRERGGAEREERSERPAEEEVSQPPEPNPESFNSSGYEGEYNNFNNNGETNTFDGY